MDDPSMMPDLSHLTEEEREIIKEVFKTQGDEEPSKTQAIQKTTQELLDLNRQLTERSEASRNLVDAQELSVCQICYKIRFADGIGRKCFHCQLRSCAICGKRVKSENQAVWSCYLCWEILKILERTGPWGEPPQQKNCVVGPISPPQSLTQPTDNIAPQLKSDHTQAEFSDKIKATQGLSDPNRQIIERKETSRNLVDTQELPTCQICYKTRFADGIGHTCFHCQVRCCARCGGREYSEKKPIWSCCLCQKSLQILARTGKWGEPPQQKNCVVGQSSSPQSLTQPTDNIAPQLKSDHTQAEYSDKMQLRSKPSSEEAGGNTSKMSTSAVVAAGEDVAKLEKISKVNLGPVKVQKKNNWFGHLKNLRLQAIELGIDVSEGETVSNWCNKHLRDDHCSSMDALALHDFWVDKQKNPTKSLTEQAPFSDQYDHSSDSSACSYDSEASYDFCDDDE